MKYSLEWLQSKASQHEWVDYLFFWGHTQKQEGVVDKSCLSQWHPAPFVVDGVSYATAEHWMMAKKALLFGDKEEYAAILATPSPAVAKKCGRQVKGFDEETWKAHCYGFVCEGNFHKFSQHVLLKQFLLYTGDRVIVEASPFDKICGIGLRSHETNPFKWQGANLLGFGLMEARDELRNK